MMRLTDKSIELLKGVSVVNPSVCFKAGNEVRVLSPHSNIFMKCYLENEFPKDFCIYDLNNFLSVLSVYQNPVLNFELDDARVVIADSKTSHTKYGYASELVVKPAPADDVIIGDTLMEFDLPPSEMAKINKFASLMNLDELIIQNDGPNHVKITLVNGTSSQSKHNSVVKFETTEEFTGDHKARFRIENFKLLPYAYRVTIGEDAAMFHSEENNVTYWICKEPL